MFSNTHVPSDVLRRIINLVGSPATDILKLFRVSAWFKRCVDSKEAWEGTSVIVNDRSNLFHLFPNTSVVQEDSSQLKHIRCCRLLSRVKLDLSDVFEGDVARIVEYAAASLRYLILCDFYRENIEIGDMLLLEISKLHFLTNLQICEARNVVATSEGMKHLAQLQHLHHLELGCSVDMLYGFHHIQHLCVEKLRLVCSSWDAFPTPFSDALSHFTRLQCLEFEGEIFAQVNFTKLIAFSCLTALSFTSLPSSQSFINFMSSCTTLRSLIVYLDFDCSHPAGAATVRAIASTPSRIERLELNLIYPSTEVCLLFLRMPHLRRFSMLLKADYCEIIAN
jgi:hypothetical protein